MPEFRRPAVASVVALAVALLPGCGGSSDPPTQATPPTTTPGPIQTTVMTGATFIPARRSVLIPFETTATGTLDVTVDWGAAANEIDLYLALGSCTVQQWPDCTWMSWSESRDFKPERLRVLGVAAGRFVLDISNIGPGEESVSYQVVLTTGGLRGQ
jgi:hypothetical protein